MIKVELANGHYYKGKILKEDSDFLKILDIEGKIVEIRKSQIIVRERLQ